MQRLSRQESQAQTRERLRQSAAVMIAQSGVHGAGIEDIVRHAGYSRGAFYANYQSKPELLVDMLEDQQVHELRLWNEMFENATDLEECMNSVVGKAENMVRIVERNRISVELQLEAERNADFRPNFLRHLDTVYAEARRLLRTILHRHGKAPPHDLDAFVVTAYQLGLNLGSIAFLGTALGKQTTPAKLMTQFLNHMIDAAPPLPEPEPDPSDMLPQTPGASDD